MPKLILPGDAEYYQTLNSVPPDWHQVAARDGNTYALVGEQSGLLRAVSGVEFREYLLGGEFEEVTGDWVEDDLLDDVERLEEVYLDL